METAVLERSTEDNGQRSFGKIVVAYDASPSAERALNDAVKLGRAFHSEIVLAQANPPDRESVSGIAEIREERSQQVSALKSVSARLNSAGLNSRGVVRGGIVGDTLFRICCEENADLLLLGAYGFGMQDRETLGSTAEYLLRALPCPVLTYGPSVSIAFDPNFHKGPVLVPISLPCNDGYLRRAVQIARGFGVRLELIHVFEYRRHRMLKELEYECQVLADRIRSTGVHAQWTLLCGEPTRSICARARETDSPFILMPLKLGHQLSSLNSDNVAAHVIRMSMTPVMTYRTE